MKEKLEKVPEQCCHLDMSRWGVKMEDGNIRCPECKRTYSGMTPTNPPDKKTNTLAFRVATEAELSHPPEQWEKEFDSIWSATKLIELSGHNNFAAPDFDAIKSFIRKTLASHRSSLAQQIEGMKYLEAAITSERLALKQFHNAALDKVLALLTPPRVTPRDHE